MKLLILAFKLYKNIIKLIRNACERKVAYLIFALNGAKVGSGFESNGIPIVDVSLGGTLVIGNKFRMNNGKRYNKIGRQQQCYFVVNKEAQLKIGNNVGISSTAIICEKSIHIQDNVRIGGNVVIYDSDFHALDFNTRTDRKVDYTNANRQEVLIESNVFIGAHSTILKGVHIGSNSIIGACSVVSKSVPENEIWAGNPAKFIRKINYT